MVDPLRLRALLERLRDEVDDLQRLSQYGADVLLTDRDKLKSVKYGFAVLAEAAVLTGNRDLLEVEEWAASWSTGSPCCAPTRRTCGPNSTTPTDPAHAPGRNLLHRRFGRSRTAGRRHPGRAARGVPDRWIAPVTDAVDQALPATGVLISRRGPPA